MLSIRVLLVWVAGLALCQGDNKLMVRPGSMSKYYLFNRNNRLGIEVDANSDLTSTSTVFVIHGHGGKMNSKFDYEIVQAYLHNHANTDVIVVDWSNYAGMDYTVAVTFSPSIANAIVDFFKGSDINIDLSETHLVGFDIGAHIAGMVGRQLDKIARITGLDPNAEGFDDSNRLTPDDAKYVEVIHTDAFGIRAIGTADRLGHVDFYPNGGTNQPGCSTNLCNHERAHELFSASLFVPLAANMCYTNAQLTTNTCTGFTLDMGTDALDKYGSGIFRVLTGRAYPFTV